MVANPALGHMAFAFDSAYQYARKRQRSGEDRNMVNVNGVR